MNPAGKRSLLVVAAAATAILLLAASQTTLDAQTDGKAFNKAADDNAKRMAKEGKEIFRFDTFGSEAFWGDQLKLHDAIQGAQHGGVGPGISPKKALELGLKVDLEKVPGAVAAGIKAGRVNLDDPANTLLLLKANAVVGVTGFFTDDGRRLRSVGFQCALCHSNVDDAFMPGIGRRLDGWPATDLNVGAIVASAPNLKPLTDLLGVNEATVKRVLNSWGPGKYDAELNLDGKGFRPDGKPAATLNPPAFGLSGVNNHTWTGAWGNVTYWNAYVANLQLQGSGVFFDPRLDDREKYPVAAKARFGNKRSPVDMVTAKLPALHFYQLTLPVPKPPRGSFDSSLAERGRVIFNSKARCATCHVPPIFTEPGWNLHKPEDIGIDDFQAKRSPDERYRTAPLRALWDTQKIHKRGFYHDGRFSTLMDVVNHYDRHFTLRLSGDEKRELIEYLKSI